MLWKKLSRANNMADSNTKIGASVILLGTFIWSFHPILIQRVTQTAPGLVILVLTHAVALVTALIFFIARKDFSGLFKKHLYRDHGLAALFIVVIPMTLFYLGARMTTGANASVLLLSELLFLIPFAAWKGEVITRAKLIGSGAILIGSFLVLFKGFSEFSWGDILIMLSTVSYPLGNFISKKLLKEISPETLLLSRLVLGLPVLFILSLLFAPGYDYLTVFKAHWLLIIIAGGFCLAISKLLWFNGIKRLDISYAVPLAMTFPVFSLVTLWLLGWETISIQQFFGILALFIGVWCIVFPKPRLL